MTGHAEPRRESGSPRLIKAMYMITIRKEYIVYHTFPKGKLFLKFRRSEKLLFSWLFAAFRERGRLARMAVGRSR